MGLESNVFCPKLIENIMLLENNIKNVFHYAPLHYLIFLARFKQLMSKNILVENGFTINHFRSSSRGQDIKRGFDKYIHLALEPHPSILKAKLRAGFPHFEIEISSEVIESTEFHLCRFNIAKTRYFRGAKSAPPESEVNGKYYDDMLLPIAVTDEDKKALIKHNYGKNMIEVLVPDIVDLNEGVTIRFFSVEDHELAMTILDGFNLSWEVELSTEIYEYPSNIDYRREVESFLNDAAGNENYRGNGLEFDRV